MALVLTMKRIPLRDVAQGIIDALRAFHGDRYDVREVHQMARQVFTLAGWGVQVVG